jgi:hypothetical protein
MRLAVQDLLGAAAPAEHSSQAFQCRAEQCTVRVGQRRSPASARHQLPGLPDPIRHLRRRNIQPTHTGMQPLQRSGVVG